MKHLNIILYQNNKHLSVDFNSKSKLKTFKNMLQLKKWYDIIVSYSNVLCDKKSM